MGGSAKQICCDARGHHIVCCNARDEVYHMTGRHGSWERLDGALKHCAVSDNGQLWGVNSSDQIYYKANPSVAARLFRTRGCALRESSPLGASDRQGAASRTASLGPHEARGWPRVIGHVRAVTVPFALALALA